MKLVAKTLMLAALMGGAVNLAYAGADAAAGQSKSAVCAACHGSDGNSMVPNFPSLAGQGEPYIIKQLKDMKANLRQVPEMMGIVPGLSEQDMADLAAYYSKQTPKGGAADPALVELGQRVFRGGNKDGATACTACHGATGKGVPEAVFPALAGQHAAYIETQLKAFRAAGREDAEGKRRTNDGESKMMQATAARLNDKEIKALSSYINGLQ